ncbi:hypothetical protein SBOR_2988 [Sclerotinia borealis F-4128]|uniref:Uncharacterized protein n=1 Tax=Sclerotinia borealis (strain F-4128) TaxID=1432307 RepID=W9CL89_SCLBF|nr:hypothetical protein SBOR_2988 [Sclerotinia borealis F-4128]
MSKVNRDSHPCRKYYPKLLQVKQASPCSEYTQGRPKDSNAEDLSTQSVLPSPIFKCGSPQENISAQVLDFTGCSEQERCWHGSDTSEMEAHGMKSYFTLMCQRNADCYVPTDEHSVKGVESPPISSLKLFDAPITLDTGFRFMDFELFDPQFEDCENYHDMCCGPSISSGSSKAGLDDYKGFDTFDTPRSSQLSSFQESFYLPPPNYVTSSWSMINESTVSLPTI